MSRLILALAIWSAFGLVCLISEYSHAGEAYSEVTGVTDKPAQDSAARAAHRNGQRRTPPTGLQRIMVEGAGRVANMTCADVSAFVAIYGVRRAELVARAAGATDSQIQEAKRCLKSSSR